MRFSDRTGWDLSEDPLAAAIRSARSEGRELTDLTVSNPLACGFDYPADLLGQFASPLALGYAPEPFGMLTARQAVADYYRDHHAAIPPARICLTASTSEAYSYLFHLLCDPGDEVLAARPSYPLLDFIARLDAIRLREFDLRYDPNADPNADAGSVHAWSIDFDALAAAITPRTRAIVLVHPNNPTGSFVSSAERSAIEELCVRHSLALIVDEVFLDYALAPAQPTFAAGESPCLTFVLSGLSKISALPQMKCSWIVVSGIVVSGTVATGPANQLHDALARLETIADTFLSVNTAVQLALPVWLAGRAHIQQQILSRMNANLAVLDERLHGTSAQRLAVEAGWTVILRVPRTVDGVPFAHAALAASVIVQPGEFYALPEGRCVLSLLTPPQRWAHGLSLLPVD